MENNVKKFMLINNDALSALKDIPDNTFHTVITSPPYFQLRNYFNPEQIGQESSPEEFVSNLVEICDEIKRVLRKDGSFWLNIGDSYNNNAGFCRGKEDWKRKGREKGSGDKKSFKHPVIKQKDLIGIPWKLAFALQKAGWYLRCDIIWQKENVLPDGAKDRPTREHEYIFLLTKSAKYFYDYYAGLEDTNEQPGGIQSFGAKDQKGTYRMDQNRTFEHYGKRNKRSVWRTPVASFKGGHFATFSQKLIDPCVCMSTSEKGCCVDCGTPWERKFEKKKIKITKEYSKNYSENLDVFSGMEVDQYQLKLVENGWEKNCDCKTDKTKPCLVLDPFSGMATTGLSAFKYNQSYVGIELNPDYLDMSTKRLKDGAGNDILEIKDIKEL